MVTAIVGFIGSARLRCCLGIYSILGVLATMGQMGIMLYLMIAPEKAVQKLETFQRMNSESTKYAGLARVKSSFGVSVRHLFMF